MFGAGKVYYENADEGYADDVVRRNAEKYLGVMKLS